MEAGGIVMMAHSEAWEVTERGGLWIGMLVRLQVLHKESERICQARAP